jgi:hypothetical protein
LRGAATQWDDLRFPANALAAGAAAADPCAVVGSTLRTRCFDGGVTAESMEAIVQWPHSMVQNSTVEPHIHWGPSDTNSGSVVWQLEYSCQNINGAYTVSSTSTVVDAADGVAHKHQIADMPSIDTSAYGGLSAICLMRIFRNPTHASDDYEHDAELYEFDIHYEVDSFGSRTEYSK